MHGAQQLIVALTSAFGLVLDGRTQVVDAVQVLERCLCTRGCPFHIPFRRAVRQHHPARGIGAKGRDDIGRVDHVLLGFRHFDIADHLDRLTRRAQLAVLDILGEVIDRPAVGIFGRVGLVVDHALGEQRVKRLDRVGGQVATNVHRACEETRVKQVQDRVLDTANILVDIHPIGRVIGMGWRVGARAGEAGEIPRTVHECVHRIGFARGNVAAIGAVAIFPIAIPVQRIAGLGEIGVFWQANGQVFFLFRHHAAAWAVDHRNGAAPEPLA